jgi:hypothetical protein
VDATLLEPLHHSDSALDIRELPPDESETLDDPASRLLPGESGPVVVGTRRHLGLSLTRELVHALKAELGCTSGSQASAAKPVPSRPLARTYVVDLAHLRQQGGGSAP